MKKIIQNIKALLGNKKTPIKTQEHSHVWKYQYSTGNPNDGQSQVSKCNCGQWAVRHYGEEKHILINN